MILLLIMFISIVLVRRFTRGDTLEEYAEKYDRGTGTVSYVPLSYFSGTEHSDTPATTPATGATTGVSADDVSVNASTGSTVSEEENMAANEVRPNKSTENSTVVTDPGDNGDGSVLSPEPQGDKQNRPQLSPFSINEIPDDIFARMQGKSYPDNCSIPREDLRYLTVQYVDFNGATQQGELVCNKLVAQDLLEIFQALYEASYPIQSIKLIDDYNADDDASVAANNTSCFCYRVVDGTTRLSNHAKGLAIDINPLYNPYVKFNADGSPYTKLPVCEPYIDRSDATFNPYRIDTNDLCYQLFIQHGFSWGGAWQNSRDYQHFEKK